MAIIRPRTSTISIDPLLAQRRREAAAREANLERSAQFLNQAFLQQAAIDYAKQDKLDQAAMKADLDRIKELSGESTPDQFLARSRQSMGDQFAQTGLAPGERLAGREVQTVFTQPELSNLIAVGAPGAAQAEMMSEALRKRLRAEETAATRGTGSSVAAYNEVTNEADPAQRRFTGRLAPPPVASTRQAPYDDLRIADQQQVMDDDSAAAMARYGEDPEFMAMLRNRIDEQNNVNMINAMLAPLLAANQPSQGATQPSVANQIPSLPPLQLPNTGGAPVMRGRVDPQVLQLMQSLAGRGIDPRTIARFLDPNQPDYSGESAGRVALQQLLRQTMGAR